MAGRAPEDEFFGLGLVSPVRNVKRKAAFPGSTNRVVVGFFLPNAFRQIDTVFCQDRPFAEFQIVHCPVVIHNA